MTPKKRPHRSPRKGDGPPVYKADPKERLLWAMLAHSEMLLAKGWNVGENLEVNARIRADLCTQFKVNLDHLGDRARDRVTKMIQAVKKKDELEKSKWAQLDRLLKAQPGVKKTRR
jgi:hypothetical protein